MKVEGSKYKIITEDKPFAQGGNGEIYQLRQIMCLNPENGECTLEPDKYVIKVLKKKFLKEGCDSKRYKRFVEETRQVLKFQDSVSHVMRIYDCSLETNQDSGRPWYLMKYAENFHKKKITDIVKKINYMLQIAETLENLHSRTVAHRDIKLDNILFIEDDIFLSDFGLVWNLENYAHLTQPKERLGPFFIGPPELAEGREGNVDYTKSDVYLFAKLVWSCLRDDPMAFRGSYQRKGLAYLSTDRLKKYPMEPIHTMLEECTLENINERPKIERCIELLMEEKYILEHPTSDEAYNYRTIEIDKEIQNNYEGEEKIFSDDNTIIEIIKTKLKYFPHQFLFNDDVKLQIKSVEKLSNWEQERNNVNSEKNEDEDEDIQWSYEPSYIVFKSITENSYVGTLEKLEIKHTESGYIYRLYIKSADNNKYLPSCPIVRTPYEILDHESGAGGQTFLLASDYMIDFAGRDDIQ